MRSVVYVAMVGAALSACETKPKESQHTTATSDQKSTNSADENSSNPADENSSNSADEKQRHAAEERQWHLGNQKFCDAVLDRKTVETALRSQSLGTRPASMRSLIAECHYVMLPPAKPGFISLVADCRGEHPRLQSMRDGFGTWKNKKQIRVGKGGVRMKSPDDRTTQLVFESVMPPCAVYLISHDTEAPLEKLANHVVDHLPDVDVPK